MSLSRLMVLGLLGWSMTALAESLVVDVSTVAQLAPAGQPIGTVTLSDSEYGLLIEPKLRGLTPGVHGFHVHETGLCDNYGLAARGHYDPAHTGKHLGPYDNRGHLGDLPALTVSDNGQASLVILAPRLKVNDIRGRALMIHLGGDNYSDQPAPLGGGEDRVACGVIPGTPKDVEKVEQKPEAAKPVLASSVKPEPLDGIPDLEDASDLDKPVNHDDELQEIDKRLQRLFEQRNQ